MATMSQDLALRRGGTQLIPAGPGGPPQSLDPVVSESARAPIIIGIVVFLFFFVGLGSWAALAPLDSAVMAQGAVKVEGNRQTLQHLDGGIVKNLLVREGDKVEAGQVLIRLDEVAPQANVDVLSGQHDALKALEARLLAERDQQPRIAFDPELAARRKSEPNIEALLSIQEQVFTARRQAIEGQVSVLRQRILQLREQIRGVESQIRAQEQQLVFVRQELKGAKELNEKGYYPLTKIYALERQVAYLDGQRGDQSAQKARAQQAIGETELQILQLERDRLAEVSEQLRDTQSKLIDIEPRLRATRDTLSRLEIKAPMAGYVVGLQIFTVGGVLSRGDKVLDIVPLDSPLVVEGQIRPDDIDGVKPGLNAQVMLTAFKQRVVPQLHATVTKVSADRMVDPKSGVPFYTVQLEIDKKELAETKNVFLVPGMPVDVMIPVRPRTALDYLLEPLTRSFSWGMKEE